MAGWLADVGSPGPGENVGLAWGKDGAAGVPREARENWGVGREARNTRGGEDKLGKLGDKDRLGKQGFGNRLGILGCEKELQKLVNENGIGLGKGRSRVEVRASRV